MVLLETNTQSGLLVVSPPLRSLTCPTSPDHPVQCRSGPEQCADVFLLDMPCDQDQVPVLANRIKVELDDFNDVIPREVVAHAGRNYTERESV
ncbi:hypothetical protein AB0K52_15230 [Glycomyces sp. NPDC049804]|uniref:hypothetical protein n=1 Tax=Glycomyces sp. NPDC049804 TaxID=3154363 RepID=UPI0034356CDF